jgi:uncharacterized protein involved in exopolysaccharide biosynthesis
MNSSQTNQHQPPAGMTVGDIYYVLFRHKWKIILLSLAGIAGRRAFHFRNAPPYQSQAEVIYPIRAGVPRLNLWRGATAG